MAAVLLWALVPSLAVAGSDLPGFVDTVAFGRRVEVMLNDREDMTSLLHPTEGVCPQYDPGGVTPLCQGVPAGGVARGCWYGRIGGDAGFADCGRSGALLAGLRDRSSRTSFGFDGNEIRLYSVALSGRTAGSLACPDCAMLVFSTAKEFWVRDEATGRMTAQVAYVQILPTTDGPRIHSWANGSIGSATTNFAVLFGGTVDGQAFFPVLQPAAPDVGTGLRAEGTRGARWPLLASAGAAAAAGSIGLAAFAAFRQRALR